MAEKRYYWLKLKRDFFKRHDIQIIEDMPNGKEYILFYLKLLCESVDHNGSLRFSNQIPYNENMLSSVTRTNVDIVRSAIQVFVGLNMMEILDDGTIFMGEVHKMLGSCADNDNANRQRRFRERKKELALCDRYDSVTKNNESKSKSKSIEDISKDISSELSDESTDAPSQSEGSSKPKKKKSAPIFDAETHEYKLAAWLDKQIAGRMAYYKRRTDAQLQEWALVFNRMNRLDGIDWDTMRDVLMWSQSDDFWQRNILSADKFRKQFAKLADQMERDYRNG